MSYFQRESSAGRGRLKKLLGTVLAGALIGTPAITLLAGPAAAAGNVAIGDAAVGEGTGGASFLSFQVNRGAPATGTDCYGVFFADGTAVAPTDYDNSFQFVAFNPGEILIQVNVPIVTDNIDEPNETFTVSLVDFGCGGGGVLVDGSATGTIIDDDNAPSIAINDITQAEGNAGPTPYNFNVTLSNPSSQTITVQFASANGTATTADNDYIANNGTLTFVPGDTSETATVNGVGDTKFEDSEFFVVNLSNNGGPGASTIGDNQGVGVLTNDDGPPNISIGNGSGPEGANVSFLVSLSNASENPVTVNFATANGTAVGGPAPCAAPAIAADFAIPAPGSSVTVPAGALNATINIPACVDLNDELTPENFFVNLSNPVGGTIAPGGDQGTGTITDNSGIPSVSINDVSIVEGNPPGTTTLNFTVTATGTSAQPITINYSTANGTAVANGDYQSVLGGQATIAAGQLTTTIPIIVNRDLTAEFNETFLVNLTAISPNATIADSQGVGTILDDDTAAPTISVNDVALNEGNGGLTAFPFNVSLSNAFPNPVTVQFSTSSGTGTQGSDFIGITNQVVTFNPGVTNQVVNVQVVGDTTPEFNETFNVTLSNATGSSPAGSASIGDGSGFGVIVNDDGNVFPQLTVNDPVPVNEGTAVQFLITTNTTSAQNIQVTFSTANGTATAGLDYTAQAGTATIIAGQASTTVTVPTTVDGVIEQGAPETFFLNLGTVPTNNAVIADNQGIGSILDATTAVNLSINDVALNEGNVGSTPFTFVVTASTANHNGFVVSYVTANGTAIANGDYQAQGSTQIQFAPGQTQANVVVNVNGDVTVEPNETFFVNLSGASPGISITDSQGQGTIINDDFAPPAPNITSLSPASGTTAGGTTVTINGTDLTTATSVTIDGIGRPFSVVGQTLQFTTPAHAAGAVQVVVTTPNGSDSATFTYVAPPGPDIITLSPNQGLVAGGTQVTISGTNLTNATSVTIDGLSVAFTVVGPDLQFFTPSRPPGAVQVVVTTPQGTDSATFTYVRRL